MLYSNLSIGTLIKMTFLMELGLSLPRCYRQGSKTLL